MLPLGSFVLSDATQAGPGTAQPRKRWLVGGAPSRATSERVREQLSDLCTKAALGLLSKISVRDWVGRDLWSAAQVENLSQALSAPECSVVEVKVCVDLTSVNNSALLGEGYLRWELPGPSDARDYQATVELFGQLLSSHKTIRQLAIGGGRFYQPHWEMWANSLAHNSTLVDMTLSGVGMEESSAVLLCKAIKSHKSLKTLDVSDFRNDFPDGFIALLAKEVVGSPSSGLECLAVGSRTLSGEDCFQIALALRSNRNLRVVAMRHRRLTSFGLERAHRELVEVVTHHNSTLRVVEFVVPGTAVSRFPTRWVSATRRMWESHTTVPIGQALHRSRVTAEGCTGPSVAAWQLVLPHFAAQQSPSALHRLLVAKVDPILLVAGPKAGRQKEKRARKRPRQSGGPHAHGCHMHMGAKRAGRVAPLHIK